MAQGEKIEQVRMTDIWRRWFYENSILDPFWLEFEEEDPRKFIKFNDRVAVVSGPYRNRTGFAWREVRPPPLQMYEVILDDTAETVTVKLENLIILYSDGEIQRLYENYTVYYTDRQAALDFATADHLMEQYGGKVMAVANVGSWWSDGKIAVTRAFDIHIPEGWTKLSRYDTREGTVCIDAAIPLNAVKSKLIAKAGLEYKGLIEKEVDNAVRDREGRLWPPCRHTRGYVFYYAETE